MSGHADRAFKMPTLGCTTGAGSISGEFPWESDVGTQNARNKLWGYTFNQRILLMLDMFVIVYKYTYQLLLGYGTWDNTLLHYTVCGRLFFLAYDMIINGGWLMMASKCGIHTWAYPNLLMDDFSFGD